MAPQARQVKLFGRGALVLGAAALALGGAVLVGRAPRAEASCSAPRARTVRTVRVTRCEVLDPAAQPGVQRAITTLRASGQLAQAAQLAEQYRGVVLDVAVERTARQRGSAQPPAGALAAWAANVGGGAATYFVASSSALPCMPFTPGARVVVDEVAPCCDGSMGAPCLFAAGSGIVRAPRATP